MMETKARSAVKTERLYECPDPSRLGRSTKTVFMTLCRGSMLYSDLIDGIEENPRTIRSSLFRLKKYNLIRLGNDSFYSLTPNGEAYRASFESSLGIRLGLPIRHPPPDELGQAKRNEEWIHAQIPEESSQINNQELEVSLKRACSELEVSSTTFPIQSSLGTITHDHQSDQPQGLVPSSLAWWRGINDKAIASRVAGKAPRLWTEVEKESVLDSIASWRKETSPTQHESKIVGTILVNACIHADVPANNVIFKTVQEAAQFFELSEDEITNAIGTLKQRRIAYLYEVHEAEWKVGIYLDFLDLLRSGRWTYA